MPTKSAGRVSIRVLPDSTRFREDLKLSLERIEKTTKVTIPATLAVTRESIRRLKEQLREIEARIKVEPYITEEQKHELKKKIEDIDPRINANLNAINAQRRLATLSRDREVTLFVKVNKASAAAAAQTLAALSGTRLVGNLFEDFFNNIKNLDKNAPKIGLISSGIAGLSAVVLAAISNFGGLIGSFAELGKTSVFLPALFTGAAISIGVLIAAFKDMKKVLGDLGPSFRQLQDVISKRFWDEAAQPIRNMVNNLMPQLKRSLGDVAQSWGRLFGNMAREIQANVTPQELAYMMGNLSRAIDIAGNAMKPLIHAFNTLGKFGSNYLPRLSDWIVKLSGQFDTFITKADKDGRLTQWAEAGIKATKDLGKVLYETGRVFSALNMAAKRAGGSNFEELAKGLKKLSDVMRTEGFQKGFETIFAGAHKAVDGLLNGLSRMGPGLSIFAVTLNTVFTEVGKILGQIGENIGELFKNPTLNRGIKDFFSGFLTFITDLKPAMGPLGEIFGTLASAAGSFVAQVGPLITEVLKVLAPLFTDVWKAIQPLIPDLITLATTLVKELGPVLATFVKEVLPPLIPIIKDLIPIVKDLVKALAPVIIQFFKDFGHALEVSGPFIKDAAKWIDDVVNALNKMPLAFFQGATGNKEGMLQTLAKVAVDNPNLPFYFDAVAKAMGPLGSILMGIGNTAKSLYDFGAAIAYLASPAALGALAPVIAQVTGLKPAWDIFWATLVPATQPVQGLPIVIATVLATTTLAFQTFFSSTNVNWSNFWTLLPGPIGPAMGLAQSYVRGGTTGISIQFGTWFATQLPAFQTFWNLMAGGANLGMGQILQNVSAAFPGIIGSVLSGMGRIGQFFSQGWIMIAVDVMMGFVRISRNIDLGVAAAVSLVTGLPVKMATAILNGIGDMIGAGAKLIGAFAQGVINAMPAAVKTVAGALGSLSNLFPHSPAKEGPFSGRGWTLYSGRSTIEAFAQGMKERTEFLKTTATGVVSAGHIGGGTFSTSSVGSAALARQRERDRALINIEGDYYGATPEKVADEMDKKQRRANLVAQLGKVGV